MKEEPMKGRTDERKIRKKEEHTKGRKDEKKNRLKEKTRTDERKNR